MDLVPERTAFLRDDMFPQRIEGILDSGNKAKEGKLLIYANASCIDDSYLRNYNNLMKHKTIIIFSFSSFFSPFFFPFWYLCSLEGSENHSFKLKIKGNTSRNAEDDQLPYTEYLNWKY